MKKEIEIRIRKEAEYLIDTKETIRNIAKIFKISKSTVHKDLQDRLPDIDPQLYKQVQNILNEHLAERHIRGGESTKLKYQLEREHK